MGSQTVITIDHADGVAANTIENIFLKSATAPKEEAQALVNFIEGAAAGASSASLCAVDVQVDGGDGVAAHGTVTLNSLVADDTVTVAKQVFTAKAMPSGDNQFALGADDVEAAANLAAKISAHPSLAQVVSATSALKVVTVTCDKVGLIGNQIGIAISAHGSVSAAFLASGANATANVYHYGI